MAFPELRDSGLVFLGLYLLGCTMGDLSSKGLSSTGTGSSESSGHERAPETTQSPACFDLLSVLRQNLNDGLQPPAAILHATADAARALTGADGAALALRTKGVIVCRACSGDPAPDFGAPVNTESGISGECLRTDSILVCDDAENDPRVDPDVCRYLGIRSIAVVPLRGPTGIAGILEVFSTQSNAFREPHIDSLRKLAEVAETAYARELRGLQESPSAPPKAARIRMLSDEPSDATTLEERSLLRRVWFVGTAVLAMLLIAGMWLSGLEPGLETSAKEPSAPVRSETLPDSAASSAPKPRAGIARVERTAAETVTRAAQIEVIDDFRSPEPTAGADRSPSPTATAEPSIPDPPDIAPGSAESGQNRDQLARLATTQPILPVLSAPVSQGITSGTLMHKAYPVYPPEAKARQISGPVTLEITIAEDGKVRDVTEISGNSLLASAARAAIRQWRYSPFLLNGKPIEVQKRITVLFKLPYLDARR